MKAKKRVKIARIVNLVLCVTLVSYSIYGLVSQRHDAIHIEVVVALIISVLVSSQITVKLIDLRYVEETKNNIDEMLIRSKKEWEKEDGSNN